MLAFREDSVGTDAAAYLITGYRGCYCPPSRYPPRRTRVRRLRRSESIMTNTGIEVTHFASEAGAREVIEDVERRIAESFRRCGDIDWRQIHVDVDGERAILTGLVSTSLQRWAAEYAARDSPGIAAVDNRLIVWPGEQQLSEQR